MRRQHLRETAERQAGAGDVGGSQVDRMMVRRERRHRFGEQAALADARGAAVYQPSVGGCAGDVQQAGQFVGSADEAPTPHQPSISRSVMLTSLAVPRSMSLSNC
jgi:hypothetical protein